MNKILKYIKNPKLIVLYLMNKGLFDFLSDKSHIKMKYRLKFNKKLNLENPQTFNEKLQWLKLYDRKKIYTKMVDKVEAKKYVANLIGKQHIIPNIGIYKNYDEIDFCDLPNQFVIKCTHNSGKGMYVCKDKSKLELKKLKSIVNSGLNEIYYKNGREWAYKNVHPRIIIEKYMGDDLVDYRFYCFNGVVKYIYQYVNESMKDNSKPEPAHCNIYDRNWNLQPFHQASLPSKKKYDKPKNLLKMIEFAEILSNKCPFLRVDFYDINNNIFFGELTFYPGGGFSKFYPEEWDRILGDYINLKGVK